jgi:hypothetical protein
MDFLDDRITWEKLAEVAARIGLLCVACQTRRWLILVETHEEEVIDVQGRLEARQGFTV